MLKAWAGESDTPGCKLGLIPYLHLHDDGPGMFLCHCNEAAMPREGALSGTGPVEDLTKYQESSLNQYIKIMTLATVIKITILPNVFCTAGVYVECLIDVLFKKKKLRRAKLYLRRLEGPTVKKSAGCHLTLLKFAFLLL